VVVDNASPDGSADMVRREFPWVKLEARADNRGFSAGVNAAARNATGDVFLILNPDTVIESGTLERMQNVLHAHPGAGALGFRQVDEQGDYQLTVGPAPSFVLELVRCYVQRRLDLGDHGLGKRIDRILGRTRRVPWVAGSVLLVTRAAFEAVGGFDESFFLYFEDLDFCLRLRATVGPVLYEPRVTVTHIRGASMKRTPELASRAYRKSQILYWSKHRGRLASGLMRTYLHLRGFD
jgi:GT2 family glycosyltransferase